MKFWNFEVVPLTLSSHQMFVDTFKKLVTFYHIATPFFKRYVGGINYNAIEQYQASLFQNDPSSNFKTTKF